MIEHAEGCCHIDLWVIHSPYFHIDLSENGSMHFFYGIEILVELNIEIYKPTVKLRMHNCYCRMNPRT
jgi:hypothetical protein